MPADLQIDQLNNKSKNFFRWTLTAGFSSDNFIVGWHESKLNHGNSLSQVTSGVHADL